jgi:hypothetical protein
VPFLPPGSLVGTLVFNGVPIPCLPEIRPHISACRGCTQELID